MTALLDSAGMLLHVLMHLAWWWVVNLKITRPRVCGVPLSIGYFVVIGWVSTDLNLLNENPAQSLAFAGLVATAVKLLQWKSNSQIENVTGCFSLAVTTTIVVTSYFDTDDPLYFSQLWALICVVVLWMHVKTSAVLQQRIVWLDRLGTTLIWFGLVVGTASLAIWPWCLLFPDFVNETMLPGEEGLEAALGYAIVVGGLAYVGLFASLIGSLGMTLKMLGNPNPQWQLIVTCFVMCLVWAIINAVGQLVR